jgi:hypothetical protein
MTVQARDGHEVVASQVARARSLARDLRPVLLEVKYLPNKKEIRS